MFCGTCIVAISWEYSEILKYLSFWIQEPAGLEDSLEDLFFGAAGAIFCIVNSQFPVGVSVHPGEFAADTWPMFSVSHRLDSELASNSGIRSFRVSKD